MSQKEYKSISSIAGPLLVVEGVSGARYEELVEVNVPGENKPRFGKVLDTSTDKAVVQMFDATDGMTADATLSRID